MAEPTVREVLEETIANHREEEPIQEVQPEPIAEETAEQKAERIRDEKGRFASTSPEPIQEAAPEPLVPIQRPSSWKKELWPVWDKMAAGQPLTDKEARQVAEYNAQREQQFASGVSTYKQEAERSKPLMDAIAPFRAEIEKYARDPQGNPVPAEAIVHGLLSAHRTLSLGSPYEKLNNIVQVIQGYGIPIQALFDENARNQYLQSAPNVPLPAAQPPAPDINSLVEEALSQREAAQTITAMEQNAEKYPFFPYVRNTMAQLLEQGVSTDLDELYELATHAPEHSRLTTALQQQQAAAEEARKLEASRKAASVARSNAISPKTATPQGTAPKGNPSVREALRESMDSVLGSARV